MAACRFVACCVVLAGIAVADDTSVPIPPKVTKIKYVSPVFFSTNDPNITVMVDDPSVVQQINNTKNLRNMPNMVRDGKLLKPGQAKFLSNKKNVETITFPVSQTSTAVTNTKSTFLFADITRRSKESNFSQLLTMSDESRRLQVEAARQAAYKAKKTNVVK